MKTQFSDIGQQGVQDSDPWAKGNKSSEFHLDFSFYCLERLPKLHQMEEAQTEPGFLPELRRKSQIFTETTMAIIHSTHDQRGKSCTDSKYPGGLRGFLCVFHWALTSMFV